MFNVCSKTGMQLQGYMIDVIALPRKVAFLC